MTPGSGMVDTKTALCASEHCRPAKHGGPRRTVPRSVLCDVCIQRTWEDLQAVAKLWDQTTLELVRHGSRSERAAPGPSTGIDMVEPIMRRRGQVKAGLSFWVMVLLDDNRIGRSPSIDDIPRMATLIATHLDHLTHHEEERLQLDIRHGAHEMKRSLRKCLGFDPTKRVDTGIRCTEHVTDDMGQRVPCAGTYTYTVHERMDGFPDLVCTDDEEHRVTPEGFRRVARRPELLDGRIERHLVSKFQAIVVHTSENAG